MLWIHEYGAFGFNRKGEAIEGGHENHGTIQLGTLFGVVLTHNHHDDDNDGRNNGTFDGMYEHNAMAFPNRPRVNIFPLFAFSVALHW